eukprot:Lithocolla_globosa_v1_NODE_4774_length_1369_cov_32.773212.p1 type:complete len:412 gc:universal NODE_4774_length_1369_cov_32.773212:1334-99(-)
MFRSLFLFSLLALGLCLAYEKQEVYAVSSPSREVTDLMNQLFDVWGVVGDSLHVLADKEEMTAFARSHDLSISSLEVDLTSLLQNDPSRTTTMVNGDWHAAYHTYNDTYHWYQDMARSHPDVMRFVSSIGLTHEGRSLFAVHITAPNNNNRKQIWIQSNIHAREWITSATTSYFSDYLVSQYAAGNSDVVDLLNTVEVIVIPHVNPDGFEYTWTSDRMWRKNRLNSGNAYGVDLNRNFDEQWGGVGSSSNPASDTYRGPSAASEPETQAIVDYFLAAPRVVGAIDVHSYSQLILRPYTHERNSAPDEVDLKRVGDGMRDVILGVHGKRFVSGTWFQDLYASSGVSQDWFYGLASSGAHEHRAYAYTAELRPQSALPGFLLPPEEIIPSGEEMTAAFIYFARACEENPLSFP